MRMNLDANLFRILPRRKETSQPNGYITPPLCSPRLPSRGSAKRTVAVALLVLMLLYWCGFSVPGYKHGNTKVVIILAANIGGGNADVR
jgi:hypothetical protein